MLILITEETSEKQGYRLHMYPTRKFQTITFYFRFLMPLQEEFTGVSQVMPFVLLQGSEKFPDKNAIQKELDRLSGALLFAEVSKKSDFQVLTFCLEILHPTLAVDGTDLIEDGLYLLENILFHPKMEQGKLLSSLVQQEKQKAIARLQNEMDNKIQYATNRMIEILFQKLPYGMPANGTVSGLEKVSTERIHEYYQNFFKQQQVEIYVLGEIEESLVTQKIDQYFGIHFGACATNHQTQSFQVQKGPLNHEDVVETDKISQAKLHLGFETGVTYSNRDYEALQVFNGIFGAFPHSKCFLTVREEHSLAYYVTSKFESHHGFLTVMTGIDSTNENQVRKVILEQLKQIQEGNLTEKELTQTKAALRNEILCALDDPRGILNLGFHQVLSEHQKSFEQWLQNIEAVTKEDVVRVSKQVQYIGSFLLKGEDT